ncbi:MAG: ISL3 family transposase [Pseudonocardiales bacterium]|nr:ISL3 family transposase [Pseudonocardiales bacterium]
MRIKSVWQQAFGVTRGVIEGIDFDDTAGVVVIAVRPVARETSRCGRCGRRSPGYDQGTGRRRWRAMDLGTTPVFLEADAPRVACPVHGPTVARVPWARHHAGHTRAFDDYTAWLAVHLSKSAVVALARVSWRTVGRIVARVGADIDGRVDRLAGLRRIGIDEISYKRRHHYLTVVVDHDTGHLVWAAAGRDDATVHRFFDELGPARTAQLTHITADMALWIARVVTDRAPHAVRVADPFHILAWASDALDMERRRAWNEANGRRRPRARGAGYERAVGPARSLKRARYALWKKPEDLTDHQRDQLAWIKKTDNRLWRAYRLKEDLRAVFQLKGAAGRHALDDWIQWARRSRLPAFVDLQRRLVKHRAAIDAALDSGLSNALAESTNTKIRLLTRVAFGFHSPEPLIALALLALSGHTPNLPGRKPPTH